MNALIRSRLSPSEPLNQALRVDRLISVCRHNRGVAQKLPRGTKVVGLPTPQRTKKLYVVVLEL